MNDLCYINKKDNIHFISKYCHNYIETFFIFPINITSTCNLHNSKVIGIPTKITYSQSIRCPINSSIFFHPTTHYTVYSLGNNPPIIYFTQNS